ncbi:hypothetical protein M9435_004349 [Picochlorum sp. BPE23]|nr:hypothetical protein M9435_004349 [Picochlorum sp. BPE23]
MSSILFDVVLNALGLVALAYGTFAVVSFLEIRDKYQSDPELLRDDYREASARKTGRAAESVSSKGRPVSSSLDDLGATATTGKKNKKKKGKKREEVVSSKRRKQCWHRGHWLYHIG